MNYTVIGIAIFIAGTLALLRTKYERHLGIIFMIRTRLFINIIDKLAKLAPRFWNFLADSSIALFFGGLGYAYLSTQEESHRNLQLIMAISGVLTAALLAWNLPALVLLLVLIGSGIYTLKGKNGQRNVLADFIAGAGFMTVMVFKGPARILGQEAINVPAWAALIEGLLGVVPILLLLFIMQAYEILFQGSQQPGVSPAIPSVKGGQVGLTFPGTELFIPLVYAIIALVSALVCHEFAHGIIARVHDLKLKSTGLLTLGILPIGAFVEPDEEEMQERPSIQKNRVFVAGSFANLLVALVAGVLFILVAYTTVIPVDAFQSTQGLQVNYFTENSSAKEVMEKGEIIKSINGKEVKGLESFRNITKDLKSGQEINITTDKGSYEITLGEDPRDPSHGYLGIVVSSGGSLKNFLQKTFFWVWFLNFNLCFVNLLPVVPFDGWRIAQELAQAFNVEQEKAMTVVKVVVAFFLILLLLNALPLVNQLIDLIVGLFKNF